MPSKCPRCNVWMQFRYGFDPRWVCDQCGYYLRTVIISNTIIEKPFTGLLDSDRTQLRGDYPEARL